ncbi:hypothetical protein VTJ49DRAFT_701 [Mycothermus thermophilus]|uniref:Zn(2)-C6 fungal-type domain-containing protein n=1 Tax=Humicola insolens TaxID=85995 RepID=A0ABR3VEC5_HUMIN
MQLSEREPTSSTDTQPPTVARPTRIDTSFNNLHLRFLSDMPERMPLNSAQLSAAPMLANGTKPDPEGLHSGSVSPRTVPAPSLPTPNPPGKRVEFVLSAPYRARLPLRVSIFLHDTTDSIVSTVKNFFGLYPAPGVSKGISFEDEEGNTLIARYENFRENMTVHVRVIESPLESDYPGSGPPHGYYGSHGLAPYGMEAHASRPSSHASRLRSPSPNGRGRRSTSTSANHASNKKGRSRSSKTRDGLGDSFSSANGDGTAGSSGRAKEQIGNTDISVENIVEGGRRKRAKFESAELPLFAPPQMPASTSNPSVSPARRLDPHRSPLPFIQSGQNPFSRPQPLQSPHAYSNGYAAPGLYATPGGDGRRGRESFGPAGNGVAAHMMTPDPTVRSAVSEEDKDVAMQLMWMSTHGRASASTQDDMFSGRAEATSSTGATSDAESDSDDEAPPARRQKLDASGAHKKAANATGGYFAGSGNGTEVSEDVEASSNSAAKPAKLKTSTALVAKSRMQSPNKLKPSKPVKPSTKKAGSVGPLTPASLPSSRTQSIASTPGFALRPGEEEQPDLSTKPRCQRCRKSKKGCDRQRPCGRCRDAGIPADQCISEDEGNGRKGRYGRHMGVPISQADMPPPPVNNLLPPAPIAAATEGLAGAMSPPGPADKNKKRKR